MGNSQQTREDLKQIYKEMKPQMGVYVIRNTINGKVFMDVSKDLKSIFNRYRFQLKMGCHAIKEMQKDWNKYGEDSFAFEVLQYLKYDEKEEKTDYSEELEIMKMIWIEKLNEGGFTVLYEK